MADIRRRLRPGNVAVLCMMAVNAVVSFALYCVLFRVFGVTQIMPWIEAHYAWAANLGSGDLLSTLLPGAAIGFGWLWFWLVLTGRTGKGVSWGGAAVYGLIISLLNVPVSGLISGIGHGHPVLGLLFGLVVMILAPSVGICMAIFGITMGLLNGRMAHRWIDRHYPGAT